MAAKTLQDVKTDLSERIGRLSDEGVVVYAACCAERYLGLFSEFSVRTGWGDPVALERVLDNVWSCLSGERGGLGELPRQLELLQEQVPHTDEFDNLQATLAQDACICVDNAAHCLAERPRASLWELTIEYAFEGVRACVLFDWTGYLDLGDDPRAAEMESRLLEDGRISREILLQLREIEDARKLKSENPPSLQVLRERARRERWTMHALMGG